MFKRDQIKPKTRFQVMYWMRDKDIEALKKQGWRKVKINNQEWMVR